MGGFLWIWNKKIVFLLPQTIICDDYDENDIGEDDDDWDWDDVLMMIPWDMTDGIKTV